MTEAKPTLPAERIERAILMVRGEKVMLDSELAELYDVETRVLNQAVTRNKERFPDDFMFQLTKQELAGNRSQIVTGSSKHRDLRNPPRAFTELGVAMLSSVLRSKKAVQVNIEIMRAFARLRRMLADNKELARKLAALERKHDKQFKVVFDALKALMNPEPPKKRPIGFCRDLDSEEER